MTVNIYYMQYIDEKMSLISERPILLHLFKNKTHRQGQRRVHWVPARRVRGMVRVEEAQGAAIELAPLEGRRRGKGGALCVAIVGREAANDFGLLAHLDELVEQPAGDGVAVEGKDVHEQIGEVPPTKAGCAEGTDETIEVDGGLFGSGRKGGHGRWLQYMYVLQRKNE